MLHTRVYTKQILSHNNRKKKFLWESIFDVFRKLHHKSKFQIPRELTEQLNKSLAVEVVHNIVPTLISNNNNHSTVIGYGLYLICNTIF